MKKTNKYWAGVIEETDDFGKPIRTSFIDGKTNDPSGIWAIMNIESWKEHGCGKLGIGYGQQYVLQDNSMWLLVLGDDE